MAWTTPRTWVSGELVTAALFNTHIRDNLNILKTPINDSGQSEFTDATELTIASGVITVTQNFHKVDTQSDAASDDLDTITAGSNVAAGFILYLRVESAARTVVLKDGTSGSDNLDLGGDVTMDESYKTYALVYDGTDWRPLIVPEAAAAASTVATILTKTSDYTCTTGDCGDEAVILTTSSGGNVTITLYAASGNSGKIIQVKKMVAANSVIVDGNSSETIDGATTVTITAQYYNLTIVCDGSNWHII